MTLKPRSAAYIALLVALGSFGPLTMSIYTPVMPAVGHDLVTTPDTEPELMPRLLATARWLFSSTHF